MLSKEFLKGLYNNLLRLQREKINEVRNEAIEHGTGSSSLYFCRLLQKIFSNIANIVHIPSMQASTAEDIWQNYINQIRSLIAQGTGEIVKPIVAIWNKEQILFQEENKVAGLYCWDSIVIIPKHYTSCIDVHAKNQSEKIFLKYSEINADLSKYVKTMFSKEYTDKLDLTSITSPGLFTNPEFIEDDFINVQEKDSRNTGWWTIYNVCMILMKLSIPSPKKFTTKSIASLEPRIKLIFRSFRLLTEECNEVKVVESAEKGIDTSINISQPLFQLKGNLSFTSDHSNFIAFVKTNPLFVDKSLFIKEILRHEGVCRIIILRPRRWGKSLNLSMLNEFLRLEIDPTNLTIKENKNNSNYNLFAHGEYEHSGDEKKFIKKLQIAEIDGGMYLKFQGQFPVINIAFDTTKSWDFIDGKPLFKTMRSCISKAYKEHIYILDFMAKHLSSESNPEKKKIIQHNKTAFVGYIQADQTSDMDNSIYFLATLLHDYLQRKVYVLIDEYDAPLTSLENDSQNYKLTKEQLVGMFKNAFKLVYYEDFLERVILTGVFRITLTSLGTGLNNFTS